MSTATRVHDLRPVAPHSPLPAALRFELPPALEATEPPEVIGTGRDDVRLLVSVGTRAPINTHFRQLPRFLDPGDVLLVNTSATMPASLRAHDDRGAEVEVHLSTRLPTGLWLLEIRTPGPVASRPDFSDHTAATLAVAADVTIHVLSRYRGSRRLWLAVIDTAGRSVPEVLTRYGRPIRYRHVPADWPIDAYQTVFSDQPGSAEMPSASRPFTDAIVTELVRRGIELAPLVLHTGVSSLEGAERPYPEWFQVPAVTAERVNAARDAQRRVVAIGTTAVRAIESAVDPCGRVTAREGWTDLVVTPASGVRVVDGLLTGWHEPEASHLLMLEAIAGRPALELAYRAAIGSGYRWHEFGDTHLILPDRADANSADVRRAS
jgi:S-adenosylmethionine:tRNA ribosyltransferase-isomerase